ncbi:MAG: endonuclease III [Clostridiaceae bacterium]|jgi:endonuclease-3|nr:endonuclease III [Clostridiaceae bacterium]
MTNNKKRLPQEGIDAVLNLLEDMYPEARCALNYRTPFQLLVATMLSAQSTDKTVNRVTETLFVKYPGVEEFLQLEQKELEEEIRQIGLYRNKAKNILAMCRELVTRFGGEVPNNREDLISLPGVGGKTANVVLSNAFNIPAIAVDTHVFRISNRIGLTDSKNVAQTEEQLTSSIPMGLWSRAHHWLIWHGRTICNAKKPKCDLCALSQYCYYFNQKLS